jgi:hypothetical protein
MATATTIMMAMIKRSNIFFLLGHRRRYRSSRQAMLVLCFGRSHKLHAAIPFAVVGGPAGNVMGTNRELVAAASLAARAAASNRSMKISASIAVPSMVRFTRLDGRAELSVQVV